MAKNNTVATNATLDLRLAAKMAQDKFDKRALLSKVIHGTADAAFIASDSAHAGLSGLHSAKVNLELKMAGNDENMRRYIIKKNKDLQKKGLFGLLWSLVSSLFVENKRSRYIGAYANTKTEDAFFKDCIDKWTTLSSRDEKKDMKIILKLLKNDGKSRKEVVRQVEDDFDKSGYPDVTSFYIQSVAALGDRIKMYKLESEAEKENRKRK